MAILKTNPLFSNLSGKVGGVVFRQRNGKTIMTHAPLKRSIQTEKQKAHQEKFRNATMYAKVALMDPELSKIYEHLAKKAKSSSPYQAAVKDFMTPPEIEDIFLHCYSGRTNDMISIEPCHKHKSCVVQVSIFLPDGQLLEEGVASCEKRGSWFTYVTQKVNKTLTGTKVKIKISDLPGREREKEVVIQSPLPERSDNDASIENFKT